MVKKEEINGKVYYQCEECKFYYETREWAQKCEDFCKKHKSCSIVITKHAVNPKEKANTCDINCKGGEKGGCCS